MAALPAHHARARVRVGGTRPRLLRARDALPRGCDDADPHQQHGRARERHLGGARRGGRRRAAGRRVDLDRRPAVTCNGVATATGANSSPARPTSITSGERDGSDLSVALEPVSTSVQPLPQVPIYVASFVVASAFLAMGVLVWLLRRGRDEAWAFGLFSSFVAVQLLTAFDTYRQTAGYERAAINFFLLAAGVFHLFTTYPFEPRWIAPRRWLRSVLYGTAARRRADRLGGGTLRHSVLRDGPDRLPADGRSHNHVSVRRGGGTAAPPRARRTSRAPT